MKTHHGMTAIGGIIALLIVIIFLMVAFILYRESQQRDLDAKQALQNAQSEAQIKELKIQSDKLSAQAERLSQQSSALQNQVEEEHREADSIRVAYINAAHIIEGVQASSYAKTAVAEYFADRGVWPSSNKDIELQAADKFTGLALQSMEVSKYGVITLSYNDKTGVPNGSIKFIPNVENAGNEVKWKCETHSYSSISTIIPNCQFKPQVR